MKSIISKEILYLVAGSFMLFYIVNSFLKKQPDVEPRKSYLQEQMDSIQQAREQLKITKLEFWYDEMLMTAYTQKDSSNLIMAKEAFFLAKSIFPERIEPRINLVRSFSDLCYDKGFFCYEARKEIHYAYRYVDSVDVAIVAELDSLYALVKDIDYEENIEFIQ